MIDRHFRMILIELALRRIRPAENIVERYVKKVRILHENVVGREGITPLIAENCRLINILELRRQFCLRQMHPFPQRFQPLSYD